MPGITLVIPVKNEAATIGPLAGSIMRQTLQPAEVIFVDGGSVDGTPAAAEAALRNASFKTRVIKLERAYPGEGRNAGIENAENPLIAFTDGGIVLDSGWLEALVRRFDEVPGCDAVYGRYEPVIDSFLKECSLMAYVPAAEKIGTGYMRTNFIASSLFRKEACLKAGGFPPYRAAEDKLFMDKVRETGARIAYTAGAVVYWQISGTVRGIFKRFCEFSAHDIMAGRARDWHHSVFRSYAIMLFFLAAGLIFNKALMLAAPAVFAARVILLYVRKRRDVRLKYAANPLHWAVTAFILLVTDAALFCGSVKYIWMKHEKKN